MTEIATRPDPLPSTDRTPLPQHLQVAAAWIVSVGQSSRRPYWHAISRWFAWCDHNRLDPMTIARAHIDYYSEKLRQEERAPATIARVVSTLSSFYAYAVEEEILESNQARKARRPKLNPDHSDTQAPDRDEARLLLRSAAEDGPRTLAMVHLMLTVGLRAAEVASARVEDLSTDRGHRVLDVTRKGGTRQRQALPPAAWRAIEASVAGRTSGPIIVTRTGKPIATSEIYRAIVRVTRRAELDKHLHPHSLRHGCATIALDAGSDLRAVQDMLGHADPRTTRRYDRARHQLDRSPAYAVAAALADDDSPGVRR